MFCPDEPVTRSTVAVWLLRALEDSAPAISASRFADVDADEWWARFTERLAALEIAAGCESDPLRFCPDGAVTRAEMASMLVRAFDLEAAPSARFSDIEGNAHEADIDALAGARIAVDCGRDTLRFCPDDAVSRAQLATFLARALGLVPLPPEFSWSLPSHCYKQPPTDPHAAPQDGCPAWWSHLMDLEPSPEGITVAETEARLAAALPFYTAKITDNLGRLSGPCTRTHRGYVDQAGRRGSPNGGHDAHHLRPTRPMRATGLGVRPTGRDQLRFCQRSVVVEHCRGCRARVGAQP